jgi:hypothetical protein
MARAMTGSSVVLFAAREPHHLVQPASGQPVADHPTAIRSFRSASAGCCTGTGRSAPKLLASCWAVEESVQRCHGTGHAVEDKRSQRESTKRK